MNKVLFVQTAFIGDAVLGTAVPEALHSDSVEVHVMVRKGNEVFYTQHPKVKKVWVWDKKHKWSSWWSLLLEVRKEKYETVYLAQRFFTMGLFTLLSGARKKIGYRSGILSRIFSKRVNHRWGNGVHEVDRLMDLIDSPVRVLPKIYPSMDDQRIIQKWLLKPFVTISPSSVWATKQAPAKVWEQVIRRHKDQMIYALGGPSDIGFLTKLLQEIGENRVQILAGELTLVQSAALMKQAEMNYVNDSGPLHLCSATNAPVTAFFCSTIPDFGFGPLSDHSVVLEHNEKLTCRPCGMHGHQSCPQGHFRCGDISLKIK